MISAAISNSRFILPSSATARGRAFERLAHYALAASGISRPVVQSCGVNLKAPGQWDGIVLADGLWLLEAKAYSGRISFPAKLERRISESRIAGLAGIIVISLGPVEAPVSVGGVPVRRYQIDDLLVHHGGNSLFLPTGDVITLEGESARIGNSQIFLGRLPAGRRLHSALLLPDDIVLALTRSAFLARIGDVNLADVPPFGKTTGEIGRLWECEDCLSGLYSPPAAILKRLFDGNGKFTIDGLTGRLAGNLCKILTNRGRLPFPQIKAEARDRVTGYPPFAYWRERRRILDFCGAMSAIADAYAAYAPYAVNLFNCNKSRACERYIGACSL